jgi:hypothetical protein
MGIKKNFKIVDIFLKNKYLKYIQKRKIFNLRFFFNIGSKKKIHKKFFKNSFFVLWALKRILKIKKKRKKIFKKIFKYKKKQKRNKFFKIFKKFKIRSNKIFKKIYFSFLKRYFKKYLNLNFIIIYNEYKQFYRKQILARILKNSVYEQKHIDLILEEFDELPEERKNKELKKLHKNFEELQSIYIDIDENFQIKKLKQNKILFVKKFNYLKISNIKKIKTSFFIASDKSHIKKNIKLEKKKNLIKYSEIFFNKDFYKMKNNNLFWFLKIKRDYINLFKKRRHKKIYKNMKIRCDDNNSAAVINILYSRFEND